jgi:hypothetical protein
LGVSLHQAELMWGISTDGIYAAERRGQLHGLHIGNRVYFSAAELTSVFGQPKSPTSPMPPALRRRHNGSDVTGG